MAKEAMTAKFWLIYGDDGILRVKPRPNAEVDLDDVILYFENADRLTEGQKVPVLVDSTEPYTTSKRGQQYSAQRSHNRIATAVVTTSTITNMLTNTYVSVFKPASPIRLFTSETEAIEWLKKMAAEYNAAQQK